jgi:hypothetical protein
MPFPLDIQFVRRAEAKLGRQLPSGYVARMCRENGGEVLVGTDSWELHPILDDSDRKRLNRTCNDIVLETASSREWTGFPSDAVAIGDNGVGDKLILLAEPGTDRLGNCIYRWDHETGEVRKIADDFAAAIKG